MSIAVKVNLLSFFVKSCKWPNADCAMWPKVGQAWKFPSEVSRYWSYEVSWGVDGIVIRAPNSTELNSHQLPVELSWVELGALTLLKRRTDVRTDGRRDASTRLFVRPSVRLLDDWLEFNGTFSTVRLYRAFRSTYSLRFGKYKHTGSIVHLLFSSGWPAT